MCLKRVCRSSKATTGLACIALLVSGCAFKRNWAPVIERQWKPFPPLKEQPVKHPWRANVSKYSPKEPAPSISSKQLSSSYSLPSSFLAQKNAKPSHSDDTSNDVATSNKTWVWPAKGHVLIPFSLAKGKKGIDIAGNKGEKIYAAADGKVVYSGQGLASYGNLLIIKHQQNFLTAYGNNLKNRVVEGQYVKAGMVIADMGSVSPGVWGLHFEIRKQGKPVNPMKYLMHK